MTELITHGVMSETPAVIINAQRGGPATGRPSKTEQSDLQAAVFGGPGDSARIVIAPTNVRESYDFTLLSFQLAERYQTPVIVLTDFFINNRVERVGVPQASEAQRADWTVYPDESMKGRYNRYQLTESGISPRAIPGAEGFLFDATGLEHTEKGRPDYSSEIHSKMTEKRHRKIQGALKDLPKPVEYSNGENLDVGVIAWGSTAPQASPSHCPRSSSRFSLPPCQVLPDSSDEKHPPDSTDIMFPVAKVRELSGRDIQSALLLYDLAPGSIR